VLSVWLGPGSGGTVYALRHIAPVLALFVLLTVATSVGAAEKGAIRGRVLEGRSEKPKSDVTVELIGVRSDGSGRIRMTTTTDRLGRYRFPDLPIDKDRVYALDAHFEGGLFAGGAVTLTSKRSVFDTTLRVWPTTTDSNVIVIQHNNLFVSPTREGLDILESVKVANTSNKAYIGRGAEASDNTASLGFALPDGAEQNGVQITSSDLDVPELKPMDFGFAITAAIPPGEYLITFAYRLPGSSADYDLSRTALYPVLSTTVHATEPLEVVGAGLEPKDEVTIEGRRYRRWSTTDVLDPGQTLQVQATAQADGDTGLKVGVGAAVLLGAGLFGWLLVRNSRVRAQPAGRRFGPHPLPESREHVLSLIAALDLRHRAGDVADDEYRRKRAELKQLLAELSATEDAR
jgi:hypothetical protein